MVCSTNSRQFRQSYSAASLIAHEQDVKFEPDPGFAKGLRYSKHQNGELVTIYYVTEQQWSRKRREAPVGEDGSTIQDRMVRAARELFPSGRFVWLANKSVVETPFEAPAQRLPNKPHELRRLPFMLGSKAIGSSPVI